MRYGINGEPLIPGVNVDEIDIQSGLKELILCGYDKAEWKTFSTIEYALIRWQRGEEQSAERTATDQSFYGVDLTTWRRVLAAARAGAISSLDKTIQMHNDYCAKIATE